MCFAPWISLATLIFEFIVATFILFYYKKSKLRAVTIFIYLLGIYQFTEFKLCTSNNPLFWAKIGFITYSFLPATGLIFCLQYLKSKWKGYHILIIPTIYSLIILFRDDLITNTVCHTYFVSTFNQFFASLRESFLGLIYLTYYFGLIILIIYLLIKNHYKEQNKIRKKINILMISAIILSLLPAIVLLFIFPTLRMSFPSIYCHFATLFTFAALRVYHLESKIKR